jgi:ABC-type branched-subunit amino acid transport system ATPase component/ABC-type branched-subunit amino acid transport system permease subunit
MLLASSWINSQVVFDGIIQGLAIAVLAVGVVLIYRCTRIINFAVANMGVVGATTLPLLTLQYHVPFWAALVVALLIGLALGILVEIGIIRRLRRAPRVVLLVATIGLAEVTQAIGLEIPLPSDQGVRYPAGINVSWAVAGVHVKGADLDILILVPVAVIGLAWFLDRTMLGKTVKACATNPELARIAGISPKLVSTMVWGIAAALATLSLVLIGGETSLAGSLASLGPQTLAWALAAALFAHMSSFPRAVIAGVVIGIAQSLISFNFVADTGLVELVVFGTVLLAVVLYGRDRSGDQEAFAFTPRSRAIPDRLRSIWWVRHIDKSGLIILGMVAVILPLIVGKPSSQQLFTSVLAFAICASSLTLITGWQGQLSLGQMAIAGIAALCAARLEHAGVPFWLAVATITLGAAVLAVGLGISSLRVRGLYLAVVTFAFALAAQQYLYYLPALTGSSPDGANVPFPVGKLWFITFSGQRTYYYAVLVILVLVLVLLSRFRDSNVGRSMKAVRDNESAAAAYTLAPARIKLRAFALAGALAGLGGCLLSGAFANVPFASSYFLVDNSLALVTMVVIGGMGSVTGAVVGAIWVIGLPAIAPNNTTVALLTSSLGLLAILLYFPRGLNQITFAVRDAIIEWADRRFGEDSTPELRIYPQGLRRREDVLDPAVPSLVVSNLRVAFGGNVAVDDVSLNVGSDEIVGLIGSNGAGKSTIMNAVGGFVPSRGSIRILGEEVSGKSPSHRASLGLGRTFQSARLFPELTVTETLLVALEAKGKTAMLPAALGLPSAIRRNRSDLAEVGELVHFLGLGPFRHHYIDDLSTGTRRVVELAGLLALNARMICLDEPTAGLAQRETEAFGPLIVMVQSELQASMLLIEHDMPLILSISDRVYCLEAGSVIAEGSPSEIRDNRRVIASYLGTDERAIGRSGLVERAVQNVPATVVPR